MTATPLAALALVLAIVAPATAAPKPPPGPIERSAQHEAARQAAVAAWPQTPPAPRHRNWVQRHPVWTAAIAGGVGGFLIGYLPGDDGVLDDFTAEFNGAFIGGIGAGGAACVVAVSRAFRRP